MKTKKWLVIAAALVLLGGIVFVGVMTALRELSIAFNVQLRDEYI